MAQPAVAATPPAAPVEAPDTAAADNTPFEQVSEQEGVEASDQQFAATAGEQPSDGLPPDEMRRRAAAAKHMQAAFGQMVSLMLRTEQFRPLPISELSNLVLPPIALGQFAIGQAQPKGQPLPVPVAGVLWALVSEDVDRRIAQTNGTMPPKLHPNEWKSGQIPWLIMGLGNRRALGGLIERLQETTLKHRPLKLMAADPQGGSRLVTLTPRAATTN